MAPQIRVLRRPKYLSEIMPQGISKTEMEIKTIPKISEVKRYEPVTCSKNKIEMTSEGMLPRQKYSHG